MGLIVRCFTVLLQPALKNASSTAFQPSVICAACHSGSRSIAPDFQRFIDEAKMRIRSLAIVAASALASVLAGISHKYRDPDIGLFENDRAALAYLQMRPTQRPSSADFVCNRCSDLARPV
jgi:hypothetical protein